MLNIFKLFLSILSVSVIFTGMGSISQSDSIENETLDYYLPD